MGFGASTKVCQLGVGCVPAVCWPCAGCAPAVCQCLQVLRRPSACDVPALCRRCADAAMAGAGAYLRAKNPGVYNVLVEPEESRVLTGARA